MKKLLYILAILFTFNYAFAQDTLDKQNTDVDQIESTNVMKLSYKGITISTAFVEPAEDSTSVGRLEIYETSDTITFKRFEGDVLISEDILSSTYRNLKTDDGYDYTEIGFAPGGLYTASVQWILQGKYITRVDTIRNSAILFDNLNVIQETKPYIQQ